MTDSSPHDFDRLPATRIRTRLGELHVRHSGSGTEGEGAAVCWSSMFVDSTTWRRMLPLLPPRRYVFVDPPGLGRSDALTRRSSVAEAAEAAIDLLGELRRQDLIAAGPVDWVGNAFGGHVGFDLATRPGVLRSLVAISSPPEALPAGLRRQIALLHPILRTFGAVGPIQKAVVDAMLTPASAAEPEILATVVEALSRPNRASMSLAVQSFVLGRRDVTDLLPYVEVPALFVAGDGRGDWVPEDARRAAALVPGARVVTVPGASTLVPLEQPAALAAAITKFWAAL